MVEDGAGQGTDGEEWSAIKRAKRDPRKITQAAQKQESEMGRKQTTPINDNKHTPGKGSTWSGTQGMEWRGMEWAGIGLRASSSRGAGTGPSPGVAVPQRKSDFNATPDGHNAQDIGG